MKKDISRTLTEDGKWVIEITAVIGVEDFCTTEKDGTPMTGKEVKGYLLDHTPYPVPKDNNFYLTGLELKQIFKDDETYNLPSRVFADFVQARE